MAQSKAEKFVIDDFDFNDRKERLGEGTSATTYKARFKVKCNSDVCAIKKAKIRAQDRNQSGFDMDKEIDILYDIKHKNIIGLFGIAYWSEKLCLVLEYACYGTMYDHLYRLKDTIDLTKEFKESTIRGICSGLKHLHTGLPKPVRHGDIKSLNVLLCAVESEIVAKIADFGLSDELSSTKSGSGSCSYLWAAPEIFASNNTKKPIKSIKSDIWSLGAFVWEIWAEKLPYSNTDLSNGYQIIYAIGQKKVVPYNPDTDNMIPEFYRSFLSNCFEFDHKKRWSITDICEYLDPVLLALDAFQGAEMEYEESNFIVDPSVRTNSALPIEIRTEYTKACFHFMQALQRDSKLFTTVKNLFRLEIPRGDMERIKSPHDFLCRLEQQALVSLMDPSLLQTRLRIIGEEGERLANLFNLRMSS